MSGCSRCGAGDSAAFAWCQEQGTGERKPKGNTATHEQRVLSGRSGVVTPVAGLSVFVRRAGDCGRGVFAHTHLPHGCVVAYVQGQVMPVDQGPAPCGTYTGECFELSPTQSAVLGGGGHFFSVHLYSVAGCGALINSHRRPNCAFSPPMVHKEHGPVFPVRVTAKKGIQNAEQLFVSYGACYDHALQRENAAQEQKSRTQLRPARAEARWAGKKAQIRDKDGRFACPLKFSSDSALEATADRK